MKDNWKISLVRLENYPRVQQEFPKAKLMDILGNKFVSKQSAEEYYKRMSEYRRRVHKPTIRFEIV